MADERMILLLKQRSVGCTLRKQPAHLTKWFNEALIIYGSLWMRADKDDVPVKGYLNELYGYLKFIALPNNITRKEDLVNSKWPSLRDRIAALN